MKKLITQMCHRPLWPKMNLAMRLSVILLFVSVFQIQANSYSQAVKISMEEKQISIHDFFGKVETMTSYSFLYRIGDFDLNRKIDVNVEKTPLDQVLQQIFEVEEVNFKVLNKQIIFSKKVNSPVSIKEDYTQQINKITGTITDVEGVPLMGVTVRIKDKNRGVFTDENGDYTITAAIGETLVYTYVGFENVSVKISEDNPLDIVMKVSVSGLDAVQVTAYGKTSKRLTTGNITTITADEIEQSPVSNVLQAVQGKIPGVYIRQTNAQPGAPVDIQVRGQNTLETNSSPLVVIDGVTYPYDKLPTSSSTGSLTGGNALNFIDPNMIESINFLKDADATAIYGSRGSNGVILITTKKGKRGKGQISFSTRNGVSFRGKTPELLNTQEYLNFRNEAITNSGSTPSDTDWDVNGNWPENRYTDWSDYFLSGAAFNSKSNVTYSGGTDNITYLLRANYNSQQNIQNANGVDHSGGLHFNLGLNSDDRKFKASLTGTYNSNKNTVIPFNNSYLLYAPNAPKFYNENGSLNWTDYDDTNGARNPASIYELIHDNQTDNLITNLNLEYVPFKGLVLSSNFGYNELSSNEIYASPDSYYNPNSWQTNSSDLTIFKIKTLTIEPQIRYNTSLGDYGKIQAQIGATIQDKNQTISNVFGTDLATDALLRNPTMADSDNINSTYNEITNRYIGLFGILNYNLSDKYLLNLNIRHDGSTEFGSGNRFGTFGSIGAGWIMSEESWFKDNLNFISFAKLRGSYGTSGGDGIGNYQYLTRYSKGFSYNGGIGYNPSGPANPTLHWEKNKKAEISVNLEFLNGRIGISESYYDTRTSDQLVSFPLSIVTGVTSLSKNSPAELRNWGNEITVHSSNIESDNFTWSTDLNLTLPNNELLSYPNDEAALPNSNYVIGKSIIGRKLYNFQGVSLETGNYNFWKDINSNGVIDNNEVGEYTSSEILNYNTDRTSFVDLQPKFYGGFQNNFRYKNFNLNVFFTFTKKKALNYLGSQTDHPGVFNVNVARDIYKRRWQQPGDITDVAKPVSGYEGNASFEYFKSSTGAYSDATYARLQNVNLSYSFPATFLEKMNFTSLRLYLQGQNLLTISNYKGYDPETLQSGVAPLRTVVLGVDFSL